MLYWMYAFSAIEEVAIIKSKTDASRAPISQNQSFFSGSLKYDKI